MQEMKRINGRKINILIEGCGQPLVLVHGFPLDHTMWNSQIDEFAKSYQVIVPDLRGFGASEGEDHKTTMSDFADDIAAILDELSIHEPINFCGLSMGGYIAWQFRELHSSRLKRMILCDTKAAADTEDAQRIRIETAEKVLRDGSGFLAEAMVEKLFSPVTLQNNSAVVDATQAVIRNTRPSTISAALLGMAERPDMTSAMSMINVPTLVIVGQHDSITTSAEMKSIAESIPEASFVEIPNAGHMAPLEQPQAVNSAIAEFLEHR